LGWMAQRLYGQPDAIASAFARLALDVASARSAEAQGDFAELGALGICREFRPLLEGVDIVVRADLFIPFRAPGAHLVELSAAAIGDELCARIHLRHGLELALLYRIAPDRDDVAIRLTSAILACNVTLEYLNTLVESERQRCVAAAPPWLRGLHARLSRQAAAAEPRADRVAVLASAWRQLLPLQGLDDIERSCKPADLARAIDMARDALPAAAPVTRLLTLGGDTRLEVDPRTGLNRYGCSPSPRPEAITFSSCTATSSSDLAFDAAERSRQALLADALANGAFNTHFESAMEQLREDLAAVLGFECVADTEIIFSPSGTDVELYALQFAMAGHKQPMLNIVLAPNEIGSGSLEAAQGRSFSRVVPLGGTVERGEPVRGMDTGRVRVVCVGIRDDETGEPRAPNDIDDEVRLLVDDAIARGEHVLIHLVDSSKTGTGAPGIETVHRLCREYFPKVSTLVDAAQMRLAVENLAAYLQNGFMVIVSGSKFYTGAPLSGALIVPPAVTRAVSRLAALPEGFGDYLSRFELPPVWKHLKQGLPNVPNVGLYIRWRAALWEMQAFASVPEDRRVAYFKVFAKAVRRAIDETPYVEWVESPLLQRGPTGRAGLWDQIQTIFTFLVLREGARPGGAPGRPRPLTHEETAHIYAWLNRDIAALLPETATPKDRTLAAQPCHVGQPVSVRRTADGWIGALRIAPGARLASRVHFDSLLGPAPAERMAEQIRGARVVLAKIGVILRHWDCLVNL
jgi:hypothetical protein